MKVLLLSLVLILPGSVFADQVIECTASRYYLYADGQRASTTGGPAPIRVSISQNEAGQLSADFEVYVKPLQRRTNRPVTKAVLTPENLGASEFQKALENLAGVSANPHLLSADSYEAYAVQRPSDGKEFVVIFSVKKDGGELGRVLMWTDDAEPSAVCAETVRI